MQPTFILALDQGTTSSRSILFDATGSIVGIAQKEFKQHYPQPGWVEHDAAEIWRRTQEVITGGLTAAKIKATDLSAIGITNQRETTVVWDKSTGAPLANAIVWQDTRTAALLESLPDATKKSITHKSGLAIAPYFSGSKMNWFLTHVPAVQEALGSGVVAGYPVVDVNRNFPVIARARLPACVRKYSAWPLLPLASS